MRLRSESVLSKYLGKAVIFFLLRRARDCDAFCDEKWSNLLLAAEREGGGVGSDPVLVGPPWKRSLAMVMCLVYILVSSAFMFGMMFGLCLGLFGTQSLSAVMFVQKDRLRVGPTLLGFSCVDWFDVRLLRHWGRFPWWGGPRTPRYYGPLG